MEMPDQCPVCGLDYIQEPGYYYGAMYVSYGFITSELGVVLFAVDNLIASPSIFLVMTVVSAVFILLSPLNFR